MVVEKKVIVGRSVPRWKNVTVVEKLAVLLESMERREMMKRSVMVTWKLNLMVVKSRKATGSTWARGRQAECSTWAGLGAEPGRESRGTRKSEELFWSRRALES